MKPTPHGRSTRLRKPAALAAISATALGAAAIVPLSGSAQTPPPTIKLKTSKNVLAGKTIKVRGLAPGPAGKHIRIKRTVGHGWKTVAKTVTGDDSRFNVRFRTRNLGRMKIRAVAGDGSRSENRWAFVYRRSFASYYGPGFYGQRTACGGTLTPSTIGVAHKSLPCGTKVRFRHRGHVVRARVIDRGPYAAGRDYDLTEATKRRLGFGSTGTVWSTR